MATAAVAGIWIRRTEEDPVGDVDGADRDTLVLWTQSKESGIYVDLRLPLDSPGRSLEAAARHSIVQRPSALAGQGMSESLLPHVDVLMEQKSFAGVLQHTLGDTTEGGLALKTDATLRALVQDPAALVPLCTNFWRRDLDFHPPPNNLDIGVCASSATVGADEHLVLRETGADGSYAEDWARPVHTANGPFCALQLVDDPDGRFGYWVRAADSFGYAVGRPSQAATGSTSVASTKVAQCVGKTLAEAMSLVASTDAERLQVLGSYVAVSGKIEETDGDDKKPQACWKIHQSLNPELVGCDLVGVCSRLERKDNDHVIQIIPLENDQEVRRTWKIMEIAGCTLPLSN